jgi:Apea-like HEPN
MRQDSLDKLLEQPYLICDERDQGNKRKALCAFIGVWVNEAFVVGPIKLRPVADEDTFLEGTRFPTVSYSVLELNYIDRGAASSIYVEPMWVQKAAFRAIQLLVDSWSGISLIYHFDADNNQLGVSGSHRLQPADSERPGILEVTRDNKDLFKRIFKAAFGQFRHPIDRFSRACNEIKEESILDFVIALEATLGFKLDSEIAHRLSCRGALLLAADPGERERYYSIFKTLYRVRSSMVHGDNAPAKVSQSGLEAITTLGYWCREVNTLRFVANVARQITRKVLIEFIKKPELLNQDNLLKLELGV